MDSIERLQQLGFNGSEARVYVTLLQHGPLSGYELAKVSGVPRANVYSVLQKLEGRGAVTRLDKRAGTRYAPVAFTELLEKLRQRFEQALEQTGQALTAVAPNIQPAPITQFDGYDNLVDTGGQILRGTRQRLMLAIWPEEAQALVQAVTDAEHRGVEFTTLCLAGCREVCDYCRGRICRYPFGLQEQERWLLLVADDEELLAGSVQPAANTVALRARQPFLVQLAAWYIRQSIAVATLITDLSLNLDETMGLQTRETLAMLLPPGASDDWLEHMRDLLRRRQAP
jgi:DNA-binding MarR family transcriptional regulator